MQERFLWCHVQSMCHVDIWYLGTVRTSACFLGTAGDGSVAERMSSMHKVWVQSLAGADRVIVLSLESRLSH